MVLFLKSLLKLLFGAPLCALLTVPALAEGAADAAPPVSAASAILIHAHTGAVRYERDADARSLIASTTKIMTALVVLESCAPGETVRVNAACAGVEGSSAYLEAGRTYTVEQLLYGMMLVSGNDAALALAVHTAGSAEAFAARMNDRARELGLENTHFSNPHGLDAPDHYSTARDLAALTAVCMAREDFVRIVSARSYTAGAVTYVNHNRLLRTYDGCLGVKTGYTRAAGRSLVSCAERDGMRLICVTLGDPDDWRDHAALYDWAFGTWSWRVPDCAGAELSLPLVSGRQERVRVRPAADARALLRAGETPEAALELPRFVFAPVTAGAQAGRVTYFADGREVGGGAMVFAESAERSSEAKLSARERLRRLWTLAQRAAGPYYLREVEQ